MNFKSIHNILDKFEGNLVECARCTGAASRRMCSHAGHSECSDRVAGVVYLFIKYWTSYWAQFLFIFRLLNNRCSIFSFSRRCIFHNSISTINSTIRMRCCIVDCVRERDARDLHSWRMQWIAVPNISMQIVFQHNGCSRRIDTGRPVGEIPFLFSYAFSILFIHFQFAIRS